MTKKKQKNIKYLWFFVSAVLVACVCLGVYVWHWEIRAHVLEVHILSTDGNITMFIRTPENRTILIDSGKSNSIIRELTSLMPFYRRTINTIILTKNDDTHVTGLVDVLERYHVGQVIEMQLPTALSSTSAQGRVSTSTSTSGAYVAFENLIVQKKLPEIKVTEGDRGPLEGDTDSVIADVLFPPTPALTSTTATSISTSTHFAFSKTNIPMLAFRIRYGSTAFVVSDLSKTEQKYIASSTLATLLSADVLISQHAGETNSMSESFLNAVHPDYIVISKKLTSTTKKTAKKPKKPPFSIYDATSTNIVNLIEKGNIEFISDGVTVSKI